jgi:hypothetical protein
MAIGRASATLSQKFKRRLNVADLTRVIAVRWLHEHVRAELPRARHKQVAVSLPAFLFQRVHRKTNKMFGARPDAFCGKIVPRNKKTRDQADDAGSEDQKYSEFHCNVWRRWLGMSGPIVQEGCVLPMDKHPDRVVLSVLITEPADAADKRRRRNPLWVQIPSTGLGAGIDRR